MSPDPKIAQDTETTFSFTVDSALLGELGEKLVSTVHVALTELVKNAYDADATQVTVYISKDRKTGPRIRVEDDGMGMTTEQVRSHWMTIGTANKVAAPVSDKYGRRKTGSKGIGRFACRRLGLHLRLTTSARSTDAGKKSPAPIITTTVNFDWKTFAPGTTVEQILCRGHTAIGTEAQPGTRLEIWGAPTDEWSMGGINYLKRQLAILVSHTGTRRRGFVEDPGFNVTLEAPEVSGELIDLRRELLDATWGTLTAHVDAKGHAHCQLQAKGIGTKKFVSRTIFKAVAGARLTVGILPVNKAESRKPEILADYAKKEIVDEWGGIQVRFNGFRMYPYGDRGDDWLRIDADRGRRLGRPDDEELFDFATSLRRVDPARVLLTALGMRNHLGFVDVTSSIVGLQPKIDREGFVDNDAFRQLVAFARFAVDWAAIHRDAFVRVRTEREAEQSLAELQPLLKGDIPKEMVVPKAASYLRGEVKRLVRNLPETEQQDAQQALFKTIKAIETRSSLAEQQLEHLRLIASASTLTLLFAHETKTIVGTLGAAASRLDQIARKLDERARKELTGFSNQLRETRDRFETLIDTTGIVGAFNRRPTMERLHLKVAVERAVKCFAALTTGYHIAVRFDGIPGDLFVGPMVQGELYTILINLISNSIKSVIAASPRERLIEIDAGAHGKGATFRVLDNGMGLPSEHFEDVFTAFVADPTGELYEQLENAANPEDTAMFGTGTGLGLAITRDIVRARKGSIKFVPPPLGWKACVEVSLP